MASSLESQFKSNRMRRLASAVDALTRAQPGTGLGSVSMPNGASSVYEDRKVFPGTVPRTQSAVVIDTDQDGSAVLVKRVKYADLPPREGAYAYADSVAIRCVPDFGATVADYDDIKLDDETRLPTSSDTFVRVRRESDFYVVERKPDPSTSMRLAVVMRAVGEDMVLVQPVVLSVFDAEPPEPTPVNPEPVDPPPIFEYKPVGDQLIVMNWPHNRARHYSELGVRGELNSRGAYSALEPVIAIVKLGAQWHAMQILRWGLSEEPDEVRRPPGCP